VAEASPNWAALAYAAEVADTQRTYAADAPVGARLMRPAA
jgi:hypothetical protein